MLPELLTQIPAEEPIGQVTADGAYDARVRHSAIAARQASARIPTRRNGRPWQETTAGAEARHEIMQATRRLGRSIWQTGSGTHRRRRVEAKMRWHKLLGEHLMARTFERQTTELHIRAALLNRLGTPETLRVAYR